MNIKRNKKLEKILKSTLVNKKYGLTLNQIEWRMENTFSSIILIGKNRLFGFKVITLLQRENGNYVLLAPKNNKKHANYGLYDILNIKNFVETYPFQIFHFEDKFDEQEMWENLNDIKETQTIGFIETQKDGNTFVYEK